MSMNITFSGGGPTISIPTSSEMNSFSNGLKDAASGDLLKALGQPGMEPWQKDAVLKELQSRAEKSEAAKSGGESSDDIQKLLKKLMDGTISQEELQKLASMLGVPPEALEPMKGKGGDIDAASFDIQGG